MSNKKECCQLNTEYFRQFSNGGTNPNLIISAWKIHATNLKQICFNCKESISDLENILVVREH